MPAHGRPVFLAEAIESVLGQTHAELRLVVLDDSADDRIEKVVEGFRGDPRLDYRRSEPLSATGAMTALIEAAEAPYFAFLHDDDRWEPGFLERRVRFLERHPDCGLVFSGHVDIDDRGCVTARSPAPFPEGVVPREELVPQMLQRNVIDTMHSVLARRSALEDAGPYLDGAFPRVFDWELWLRLVLRHPAGCLAVEDAQYRAHEEQMSGAAGRAEDFKAIARHADRLVSELAPGLRLPPEQRRRTFARLELSAAVELLGADDPVRARAALRAGVRAAPGRALRDPRLYAALLGLAGGRPARRLVGGARALSHRRDQRRRRGRGV
jgi:glycosyltransferase involved in cell wall biosynthesis